MSNLEGHSNPRNVESAGRSHDAIRQCIAMGEEIKLTLHTLTSDAEKTMRFTLERVLEKYTKEHLFDSVFSVLYEVVANGTRANFKRIFFEENGLDMHNPDEYERGLSLFKEQIGPKMLTVYGDKSREKGKEVRITFRHGSEGLCLEAENNTELLPLEGERIRLKLEDGLKHESLFSFFAENPDHAEGEGLGLAYCLLLLKSENLDPSVFQIGTRPGLTFARIEIPFVSDQPTRN